jgi:hypothetical protein
MDEEKIVELAATRNREQRFRNGALALKPRTGSKIPCRPPGAFRRSLNECPDGGLLC